MPGAPHATSGTGLGLTAAAAAAVVPPAQRAPLVDGSSVVVPPQIIAAPHSSAGGSFAEGYALMGDDEEEEVMGGGCVATSGAHKSSAFVASGGSGGLSGGSRYTDVPMRSESAVPVASAGDSSSGANTSSVDLHLMTTTSSVQPVTLDRRAASHAAETAASLHHLDPFSHIYSSVNDAVMTEDDNQAISSPEDYSAVAYDAYLHWRARRKLSSEALTQSVADIADFVDGSHRRRLRLVLIQLHFLLDNTPRVYAVLCRKRILDGPAAAQTRTERELNSHWSELKTHCSLLVLDKDMSQCAELVASTVAEVIGNCALLWEMFDVSVRGLLLVDSSRECLSCLLSAAQNNSGAVKQMLTTLLDAYDALPDLFKKAIKSTVESVISTGLDGARLVIGELQERRVLPGALFKALGEYTCRASQVVQARRYLDNIFRIGAASWIGIGTGLTRPKYSVYGDGIREALYSQFGLLSECSQRRDLLSYARVISGLIGYLRLNIADADYAFFKRASLLVSSPLAVDTCAALLLVLVGFSTLGTTQDALAAISNATETPISGQIDCLLAYLQTSHVKEVNDFISGTLGMDFTYPRERLFFIKDAIQQAKVAYYSGASIARRLIAQQTADLRHAACSPGLYREAILYSLQGELFQHSGVDVREWITQSIFSVDASTASAYGKVIKAYVDALFSSAVVTPVPETLLWKAFAPENTLDDTGDRVAPSQVLFLLYLLYYCERLQDKSKAGSGSAFSMPPPQRVPADLYSGNSAKSRNNAPGEQSGILAGRTSSLYSPASSQTGSPLLSAPRAVRRGEYSDQLLDSLPVAWILRHASKCAYSPIWPELLAMSTTQFPDQLDTVSVLQGELATDIVKTTSLASGRRWLLPLCGAGHATAPSCAVPDGGLALEGDALSIFRVTEDFERLPISARMKGCCALAERICRSAIVRSDSAEFTACARQAWLSLHALNPHLVSAATINAWRSEYEATKPLLAPQDMWLDPLVIFRSDTRIFQSPSLVDVFLIILAEYLALSRTSMLRIFALRQRDGGALKKAHLSAILQLQETGSLQMLIEIARASTSAKVKRLIYEFVHARFLEQRTTQKLLHFQAYAVAAIGDMVKYVPSMHACSEFIPELLMQSAPRLQLFAIKLAAAVLAKYPIAANEGMAKEVILPHILTTLVQLAGSDVSEQLAVCNAMFEAVLAIGASFSLVRDECKRLVNEVKEAANDLARNTFQHAAPLQKQAIAKWIGCCEGVLASIRLMKQPVGAASYTPIEDVDASELVARFEKPLASKKGHASNLELESPLSASSGSQQSTGTPRPPGTLVHHKPPRQGPHKRPHGAVDDERSPHASATGATDSAAPAPAPAPAPDPAHSQRSFKKRGRPNQRMNGKDGSSRPSGPGPKRNKTPVAGGGRPRG
ncbi:Integrator complex subunit 2 [Coemansia sp. RSA 2050]|nr:Integrator complex subunit 2 [Coemansia sp. RSA 2050]